MKKGAEEMLSRVLETLEAVGKFEVGHGWKDQVNRSLGKSKGFINHAIERRNLRLDTLFWVLEALGKDPSEFLLEVMPSERVWDPLAILISRAHRLEPVVPSCVKRAKKALAGLSGTPKSLELADREFLEELDVMRYRDPHRAVVLAESALENLLENPQQEPRQLLPWVLARWASGRRRCDDPDGALVALIWSLRWAEEVGNSALKGDIFRRLAYCYCDHFGDYHGALSLTDLAIAELLISGESAGVARSLVSRGCWLYYLDRFQESLSVLFRALEMLPGDDIRHRYSCHEYRALAFRELGQDEEMWFEIDKAKSCDAGPMHSVTLVWLEGSIAAEERRFDTARRCFLECMRLYSRCSPVNAALVSLELIDLYLAHQLPESASEAAHAMFPLIEPLERFPVVAAAITKLIEKSTRAKLDARILTETRRALLWARAQSKARAQQSV